MSAYPPARLYDLTDPAERAAFLAWHDTLGPGPCLTWEDRSLLGLTARTEGRDSHLSPDAYGWLVGHLRENGVNPRDRSVRRGDLN